MCPSAHTLATHGSAGPTEDANDLAVKTTETTYFHSIFPSNGAMNSKGPLLWIVELHVLNRFD
jgi:hypothetical protein